MQYYKVTSLELEATCVGISQERWDELMKGSVKANKKKIDQLVKKFLPDLYHDLALNAYNPYTYRRTKTHLILIHSGIEYFLKFETRENRFTSGAFYRDLYS